MTKKVNSRTVDHECNDLFPNRWSPRAMSGEAVTDEELHSLFEAARWAPSCMNSQPWRFIYAKRDTQHWELFFNLLVAGNRVWCANAGVLVVMVAKKSSGNAASPTSAFDAGAAWENLALQATHSGLVCHGMAGFDYTAAAVELGIPADCQVMAMAAIGRPGNAQNLPEALREREKPNSRIAVSEFTFEGSWR